MGRIVKYKNYNGMRCKEVYYNDEVDTITQLIVDVSDNYLKVVSRKGKEYWVKMSDRVVMTMNPRVKDMAVIKTFPNGWLVVDVESVNDFLFDVEASSLYSVRDYGCV